MFVGDARMCIKNNEFLCNIIIKYLFYTTFNQSIVFANLLFNIYRLGQYAALRFYFIRAYHCDSPPGGALPTLGSSDQVQDTLMGLSDFFTQELPTQVTRVRVCVCRTCQSSLHCQWKKRMKTLEC